MSTVRVEVTQDMIDEARRRGLTGEQLIEMAVALAVRADWSSAQTSQSPCE
jgi:alkylhydroperoxidase/carboxymuconolactone decarboxylase family protein YurZ